MADSEIFTAVIEGRLDVALADSPDGVETFYFPAYQVISCLLEARDVIAGAPAGAIDKDEVAAMFHSLAMSFVNHIEAQNWDDV